MLKQDVFFNPHTAESFEMCFSFLADTAGCDVDCRDGLVGKFGEGKFFLLLEEF